MPATCGSLEARPWLNYNYPPILENRMQEKKEDQIETGIALSQANMEPEQGPRIDYHLFKGASFRFHVSLGEGM